MCPAEPMDLERDLQALKRHVEERHDVEVEHVRSVPVTVEAKAEEVWQMDVHEFVRRGGDGDRYYAFYQRVRTESARRPVVVPSQDGVTSPEAAVRAVVGLHSRGEAGGWIGEKPEAPDPDA